MTGPPATLATMRADRLDPNDPNIKHLRELADTWHHHIRDAEQAKTILDRQLAALKTQGYSYPVLAKTAGMAIASVQYAVAKEARMDEHECPTPNGNPGDQWTCRICGTHYRAEAEGSKYIAWREVYK